MNIDSSFGNMGNIKNIINNATNQAETAKSDDFKKRMDEALKNNDDTALMDVCKQFESYFIKSMLKNMRQTLSDDTLIPKSDGEETFTDMLDDEYSKKAADVGGIGIANLLYKQLKGQTKM